MLGDRRFHVLLVAQHSQLFEQLALLAVEFGGSEHVDMDAGHRGRSVATGKHPGHEASGTLPLWVPARTSIFCSPSRVCSGITVPSAAAVMGMLNCTQVVALAFEDGMRLWMISTYTSPAGPLPGPPHLSRQQQPVPVSTRAGRRP